MAQHFHYVFVIIFMWHADFSNLTQILPTHRVPDEKLYSLHVGKSYANPITKTKPDPNIVTNPNHTKPLNLMRFVYIPNSNVMMLWACWLFRHWCCPPWFRQRTGILLKCSSNYFLLQRQNHNDIQSSLQAWWHLMMWSLLDSWVNCDKMANGSNWLLYWCQPDSMQTNQFTSCQFADWSTCRLNDLQTLQSTEWTTSAKYNSMTAWLAFMHDNACEW